MKTFPFLARLNPFKQNRDNRGRIPFLVCGAVALVCGLGYAFHNRTIKITPPVGSIPFSDSRMVELAFSAASSVRLSGTAVLTPGRYHLEGTENDLIVQVQPETKALFELDASLERAQQPPAGSKESGSGANKGSGWKNHLSLKPMSNTQVRFAPPISLMRGGVEIGKLDVFTLAGSGDAAVAQCRIDLVQTLTHLVFSKVTGDVDAPADRRASLSLRSLVAGIDVRRIHASLRGGSVINLPNQSLVLVDGSYVQLSGVKWQASSRFVADAEVKLSLAKGTILNSGDFSLAPDQGLLWVRGRFDRGADQDEFTVEKPEQAVVALSVSGGSLSRKTGSIKISKLEVNTLTCEWRRSKERNESLKLNGASSASVEIAGVVMRGNLSFADGKLQADGLLTIPFPQVQAAAQSAAGRVVGLKIGDDFEIRSLDVLPPGGSAGELKLQYKLAPDVPGLLRVNMCSEPLIFRITGALKTREDGCPTSYADLGIPALAADLHTDGLSASLTAEATLASSREIWFYEWTKNQCVLPRGPFWDEQVLHMRLRVKTHPFSVAARVEVETRLEGESLVIRLKSIGSKNSDQAISGFVDTHDMGGAGANCELKPFDCDDATISAKILGIVKGDFDIKNPVRAVMQRAAGMEIRIPLRKS
jgi:hypothetical protein